MTRRRIFKEGAWSRLAAVEKGLVIGIGAGVVFWVFTGTLSWLAVGVFLGVGIGHHVGRRPTRAQRAAPTPGADTANAPRRRPTPPVLTEEQRETSLHSSAGFQGLRMVEGKQDRAETLTRMRETIGGFPHERYEAELDAALARIEEAQVKARARRQQRITEARQLDLLNAVFALYYFNSRHSRHPAEAGLGSIGLYEALGDLYTREQIDEAKKRSGALIEEGWSCAVGAVRTTRTTTAGRSGSCASTTLVSPTPTCTRPPTGATS